MSKIIKVLDTEHIEIREYRNPNLVFNTNEYDINDKICILREVINPFIMQQQIQELTKNWNELEEWVKELQKFKGINQQGFSWGVAQEVLDKMKEIKEGSNDKKSV